MTESHNDLTDELKIFVPSSYSSKNIVPPRAVNVLNSKPWVPFKIGDMRDGSNDYKAWPSKYFD